MDRIHTTRRAQVLSQDVADEAEQKRSSRVENITKPERVFVRSNPKPMETSTTFPEQLINSNNSYDLFLDRDPQKAVVFKNFRNYNRDLTKAYLRQAETQSLFEKAKGGALPEHQIKQKKEDDETFTRLSNLYNTMRRRSRYGNVEQSPSFMNQKKLNLSSLGESQRVNTQDQSSGIRMVDDTASNSMGGVASPPQFGAGAGASAGSSNPGGRLQPTNGGAN